MVYENEVGTLNERNFTRNRDEDVLSEFILVGTKIGNNAFLWVLQEIFGHKYAWS